MTRKFFFRDTDETNAIHVADHEDASSLTAGAGETEETSFLAADASRLLFSWVSPSNEPNDSDWDDGTYDYSIDCSGGGSIADMDYGFLVVDLGAAE